MSEPTQNDPSYSPEPKALHQPFSWLPAHHQLNASAQFYALTKDVCQGIQTCVDLAHFSVMDRGSDTTPVLNIEDTDRLLRLAVTSSRMLAQIAAVHIDGLDDRAIRKPT
ncbi:hypothetical protein [Glaciimonas sp. PAMC28666]|uniref:hypothetical protein n=1 Tax=Glaciimonas sp. PAMC28666 TaxID=2807626 RepID=UPI0019659E36|nr:hypothetical protein [Glaciimonas sp. PAMC28666]QRX82019.1 hypothetical protein JQN73_18125 [Glaciimonas sp. PAMC28666]